MIKKYIKFFLFACICFIIADFFVNADTLYNNNNLSFFNNNGSSFNSVSTSYIEQINESSAILTTVQGSYGGLVVIQLSTPLIENHIYSLFLNVGVESNGGRTKLSAKNCLGVGATINGSADNYVNCQITPKFSDFAVSTSDKGRGVFYSFIAPNSAIMLAVPYTSEYTCSSCRNYSFGYTLVDGGDSRNLSEQQINTIINNQTTNIQNQITQSQNATNQTIIDSASNTDSNIANSANNTQDAINNGLQNCTKQFKYTLKKGKAFDENGNLSDNPDSYYTKKYYSLSGATKLTISNTGLSYPDSSGYIIIYDSNKQYLDFWSIRDTTFELPSGASYYRLSTEMTGVSIYEGDGCTSKIDAVNDTLKDDAVDSSNATDTLSNLSNSTASNSVISDLLLLPVRLFQNIVNSINGSCSPFSLGTLFNTNLTLPCINIPNLIGSTLWSVIDILFCGSFILVIRKKFVDIFENLSELKNGGNDVE